MTETSDRVSFIQRDKAYYKKIVTALKGKATMDLIYCDNKKRLDILKKAIASKDEALRKLENGEQKTKKEESELKKTAEAASTVISRNEKANAELEEVYGDSIPERICLGAAITSRFGKTAICFYGGTRNLLRNTFRPTHFLNWQRILVSFEKGMLVHDLGRVTGDPYDESNPLAGLCKYKQSYGGSVIEYVGDTYLVNDKFRFWLFRNLLPAFKKIKNRVFKKRIKSATVAKAS